MIILVLLIYYLHLLHLQNAQSIYRVATTIKPISYNITFYPNFVDDITYDFEGWEYITINISIDHIDSNDNPFEIRINQGIEVELLNISISLENTIYSSILNDNNTETQITNISFSITNNEVLSLINTNSYIIGILYILYTSMYRTPTNRNGVFLSTHAYNKTLIKNIVTQFESVFARSAFPSFDTCIKINISIYIYCT
eukprot:442122_1